MAKNQLSQTSLIRMGVHATNGEKTTRTELDEWAKQNGYKIAGSENSINSTLSGARKEAREGVLADKVKIIETGGSLPRGRAAKGGPKAGAKPAPKAKGKVGGGGASFNVVELDQMQAISELVKVTGGDIDTIKQTLAITRQIKNQDALLETLNNYEQLQTILGGKAKK